MSRCLTDVRLVTLFATDYIDRVVICALKAMADVKSVVGDVVLESVTAGGVAADGAVGVTRKETRKPRCLGLTRDVEDVVNCRPDRRPSVALPAPVWCNRSLRE